LVNGSDVKKYIKGLVAQLRFVHQICPKDAIYYTGKLRESTGGRFLSTSDKAFLETANSAAL
jgi:hypothetical protein